MLPNAIKKEVQNTLSSMKGFFSDATYKVCTGTHRVNYQEVPDLQTKQIKCVVSQYSQREIREDILISQSDKKVVIPRQGLDFEIKVGGELIIGGVSHYIVTVQSDPAGALYLVQARVG